MFFSHIPESSYICESFPSGHDLFYAHVYFRINLLINFSEFSLNPEKSRKNVSSYGRRNEPRLFKKKNLFVVVIDTRAVLRMWGAAKYCWRAHKVFTEKSTGEPWFTVLLLMLV